jgi:membrane protein implicated in regulation of membrane protease activity
MATLRRSSRRRIPDAISTGWLVALGASVALIGATLGFAFTVWLPAVLAAAVIAAIGAVIKAILERRSTRHREEIQASSSEETSAEAEVEKAREPVPEESNRGKSREWKFSVVISRNTRE